MNDDNLLDYEYDPDEHNEYNEYSSGYKSPYNYDKETKANTYSHYEEKETYTERELVIASAACTIQERNPTWDNDQCLEVAIKWFNKKYDKGELTIHPGSRLN